MVTIQANKSGISPQLLSGVKAGEIVLIEDDHHAFAIVIPGSLPKKPRPAGLCKGEFVVPDDFNEPLDAWDGLEEELPS